MVWVETFAVKRRVVLVFSDEQILEIPVHVMFPGLRQLSAVLVSSIRDFLSPRQLCPSQSKTSTEAIATADATFRFSVAGSAAAVVMTVSNANVLAVAAHVCPVLKTLALQLHPLDLA